MDLVFILLVVIDIISRRYKRNQSPHHSVSSPQSLCMTYLVIQKLQFYWIKSESIVRRQYVNGAHETDIKIRWRRGRTLPVQTQNNNNNVKRPLNVSPHLRAPNTWNIWPALSLSVKVVYSGTEFMHLFSFFSSNRLPHSCSINTTFSERIPRTHMRSVAPKKRRKKVITNSVAHAHSHTYANREMRSAEPNGQRVAFIHE